ncbi:hypothetical protein DF3PB_1610008 [uncultured Defluviicoccus sp.]|uniref:Uncharacterized protein n=1 Tax=metagenome TaxID=256318 RepID=A0A380TBX5_9ZZZZ|nr:hypothetical protein DF3PB_1610008 [uncultured Defluviicoccus sp.]
MSLHNILNRVHFRHKQDVRSVSASALEWLRRADLLDEAADEVLHGGGLLAELAGGGEYLAGSGAGLASGRRDGVDGA